MAMGKRLWPLEVILLTALCAALYWCGAYQLLHLYFSYEAGPDLSILRCIAAFTGIVLVMAFVRGYPLRHAIKGLRSGEVSVGDFEPWRKEFEKTRWTVVSCLLALPSLVVVFGPSWNGSWLLSLLPLAMLIHIRAILRLPEPTHPSNRIIPPPPD